MSLTRLEEDCLEACVREELFSSQLFDPDDMSVWLKLGFKIMLKAGSMTRATRLMPMRERVHFKKDGSPTTSEESQIEHYARDLLLSVNPDIQFLGEETGGEVKPKGYAVAMDPIPKIRKKFTPNPIPCDDFLVYLAMRKFWDGCQA
jgi:hypothetical protein